MRQLWLLISHSKSQVLSYYWLLTPSISTWFVLFFWLKYFENTCLNFFYMLHVFFTKNGVFSRFFHTYTLTHAHAEHVFQFPFISCLVDNAENISYHKQKSSCMLRILVGKAISMIIDYGDDSSMSMCWAYKENCIFSLLSSLLFICQQQQPK